ncbi:MAG: cell division protein ZipA C-terminal FtsZ-binding domain-containing protein [Gammaproteobacteria bacterium]|jgi:hypothetical protein|nr:cell division protein ZipA C-terminal FtsZ-binding domain-containing protein [Gammaproteobacteria bacterium]|tara:strand:- start:1780 stop:2256 length:477 start_codon:yes stop_codon:yes gene_type:complete
MENSWILLSIIFILLITLLIYEKRKRNKSDNQLSINEKFIINDKAENNEVLSIRLSIKSHPITLKKSINIFKTYSIILNKKGIFEKYMNDSVSYFVANLYEPGYFIDDQNIQGFTFYFVSEYQIDDKRRYDEMKQDVTALNQTLEGNVSYDSITENKG